MWEIYVGLCVWSILLLAARSTPAHQNNYVAGSGKLRAASFSQNPRRELRNQHNVTYRSIPKITGEPACAAGQMFCEHIDTYPHDHIRKILKENGIPKGYFKNKSEVTGHRARTWQTEENFCASREQTITPLIAKNNIGEWKFIIHDKEGGHFQSVQVETCIKQDEECPFVGGEPPGYKAVCKQRFIFKRLLSLDDLGGMTPDTIALPSACCCIYKYIGPP